MTEQRKEWPYDLSPEEQARLRAIFDGEQAQDDAGIDTWLEAQPAPTKLTRAMDITANVVIGVLVVIVLGVLGTIGFGIFKVLEWLASL